MMCVEVAVNLPVDGTFTYLVPKELEGMVSPGVRVKVPFGKRTVVGYVLEKSNSSNEAGLKEIYDVLDQEPLFHENMVQFLKKVSEDFLSPIGEVLRHALPGGLNINPYKIGHITERGEEYLKSIKGDYPLINYLRWVKDNPGKRLPQPLHMAYQLRNHGFIEIKEGNPKIRALRRTRKYLRIKDSVDIESILDEIESNPRAPKNELEFFKTIIKQGEVLLSIIREKFRNGDYLAKKWIQRGVLDSVERPYERGYLPPLIYNMPSPDRLYPQQIEAINTIGENIKKGAFSVHLIHGVAGSGKTEVYFEAIKRAIEMGKKAIFLVPEIALSNYMAGIFNLRMGKRVAVYHSGLSYGERYEQWMRISRGEVDLVIGARSSIFAPFPRAGLIVVDEEHDPSYKQEEDIRYSTKDLILLRAKQEGAVVVLGSATPSVESYYRAMSRQYILINMPERVKERPLPEIMIVDMKKHKPLDRDTGLISAPLYEEIKRTLEHGKQVMLFLNRRGFVRLHICVFCGKSIKCINCDVALVYHYERRRLICHYCGYSIPLPQRCPHCNLKGLKKYGYGTERVESILKDIFPHTRIARMDRDSVSRKGESFRILRGFQRKDIDIIVGTQMITKGYNFPEVTLVGILMADLSLNFPDFRAGERTFQLLAQSAGRSGRGMERGKVIIQSFSPVHYTIKSAEKYNYQEFYKKEIALRKTLGYPPFVEMALLRLEGNKKSNVSRKALEISDTIRELYEKWFKEQGISVLGPVEAPIFKLKGRYRYQILIKAKEREILKESLSQIKARAMSVLKGSGVSLVIDFSP